jgi:hypothetical protein
MNISRRVMYVVSAVLVLHAVILLDIDRVVTHVLVWLSYSLVESEKEALIEYRLIYIVVLKNLIPLVLSVWILLYSGVALMRHKFVVCWQGGNSSRVVLRGRDAAVVLAVVLVLALFLSISYIRRIGAAMSLVGFLE